MFAGCKNIVKGYPHYVSLLQGIKNMVVDLIGTAASLTVITDWRSMITDL